MSGASLSLFSRRYLTSEISRQPALLNSENNLLDLLVHSIASYLPGPNFKVEASSSSAAGRCRNLVVIQLQKRLRVTDGESEGRDKGFSECK